MTSKLPFNIPSTYRGRAMGLVAIVTYKLLITGLFLVLSLAIFLTMKNADILQNVADSYELSGRHGLVVLFLDKLLNITPKTLKFGGFAAAGYGLLSGVEAIGLWRQKAWAHVLVLLLVGISILPEIYELSQGFTLIKFIVFFLNVVMFGYLLTHLPKHHG